MKGKHKIVVSTKRLKYEFELHRNLTIIRGDSATGKTTLVDMIRDHINNPSGTPVELVCDKTCYVLEGNLWKAQDKNSKIMPLAEMMILRDLMDNRKEQLSELSRKVQKSLDETKKLCNDLVNSGLIEIVGKEYMLTAKVYEALKSDVEYTRDKTVQYIKAKNMILEYLQTNDQITSAKIQEMCGFTKQQARSVIDKMRSEKLMDICRKGNKSYYVRL